MKCSWCVVLSAVQLLILLLLAGHGASSRQSSFSDSQQCSTPRLKNGRIRARGRGRIIRFSCYADYELVGNKYSTCIRGSWDTPTPICVSTKCPAAPVPAHAVVGEKYRGAILMYFCEPGHVLVGNAEIYCDGRQWNGTAPYCRGSNAVAPTSCDFEKDGLCWWEQDPKHDFDWIRHRFDTPSSHIGTGPTHDHSLGPGNDGYYLYIEATGRLVNDTARIISPLYSANLTEAGCFSFWYHMYGATIGSLNVYFKSEADKSARLAWSKHGNQGNQWRRGVFELPPVNSSFQIIVEGVRGSSYVSDIAVDDVAVLQGDECALRNLTLGSTSPAPDGDEVEVYNAMQSCRERCVNASLDTTPSSELYSNPDVCQCTLDCADTSTCCPDYNEYCIYELTDQPEIPVPVTNVPLTKDTSVSASIESHQTKNSTTVSAITTSSTTTTTTTTMMTNPYSATSKSARTTGSTDPSKIATTRRTTTEGTTKLAMTTETKVTSKKRTRKPTIATSTTPVNLETPFVPAIPETTNAYSADNALMHTEAHVLKQDAIPLEPSAAQSLSGIFGVVVGVFTGLSLIAAVALIIYRRRKFYTRSSDGSADSEDCTVGFLADDETLDFSLAKPSDDYGKN